MRACSRLRARQCDCSPAGFSVEAHATAWQVAARPQLAVPWTRCEPAEACLTLPCSPRSLPRSQCNAMTTTRRFAYFEHGLSAVATASHSTSFASHVGARAPRDRVVDRARPTSRSATSCHATGARGTTRRAAAVISYKRSSSSRLADAGRRMGSGGLGRAVRAGHAHAR